jgi:hypothetical protein
MKLVQIPNYNFHVAVGSGCSLLLSEEYKIRVIIAAVLVLLHNLGALVAFRPASPVRPHRRKFPKPSCYLQGLIKGEGRSKLMVAALKDIHTGRAHRPIEGIILGALIGALLWLALIIVVVAV